MKLIKNHQGFTLIEALVVILVVGILGYLLSDLLLRTFRGGNKTQLIGDIKQNGQSALNTIDYTVRTAERIVCPPPGVKTVTTNPADPVPQTAVLATVKNGKYTVFWFNPPKTTSPVENGYISLLSTENDPVNRVGDTIPVGELIGYCSPPSLPGAKLNAEFTKAVFLTDKNTQTGVSLKPGAYFQRNSQAGSKDEVSIQFELGPGELAASSFDTQIGTGAVLFSTTVRLR